MEKNEGFNANKKSKNVRACIKILNLRLKHDTISQNILAP